jgi:tRNA(Ile)-lysidine synthase
VRPQSEENAASGAVAAVERAVTALPAGRWLLAVSGGRDSMALLDAMARRRRGEIAAVATFDHGTGAAARRACALVERAAEQRELPVVSGRTGAGAVRTEAAWREARWRFLGAWAEELAAKVVTAHTRDDQIETVVLRILRGSGARGLAGMLDAAGEGVLRPLLAVPRSTLAEYCEARRVPFVEDPSNADRAHQRNRVRHDLLPALERARPGFAAWCWELGERAARLRGELESFVDDVVAPSRNADGAVVVRAAPLAALGASEWSALWPALAARAGVVMDRRGIERAAEWAPHASPGAAIPLAGGATIARTAATYVIRSGAAGTTAVGPDYILEQ